MSFVTAWGLLPIAVLLACITVRGVGALPFPHGGAPAGERLLGGATVTLAIVAVGVRLIGAAGVLSTAVVLGGCVAVAASVVVAVRTRGLSMWPRRLRVTAECAARACRRRVRIGDRDDGCVSAARVGSTTRWATTCRYVNFALQRGHVQ